jgi:hypothetical protein
MPAIKICESCDSAHWADREHNCRSSEYDRLEAQYNAMKAKKSAKEHGELLERCKQLKWLAGNILHHGPDLPSRTHWSCLYRLAEQAEVLAKGTLDALAAAAREGQDRNGLGAPARQSGGAAATPNPRSDQ